MYIFWIESVRSISRVDTLTYIFDMDDVMVCVKLSESLICLNGEKILDENSVRSIS